MLQLKEPKRKCGKKWQSYLVLKSFLPAQNAENQIEHEEASNHDKRDEEHPVKGTSYGVIGLKKIGAINHFLWRILREEGKKIATHSLDTWIVKNGASLYFIDSFLNSDWLIIYW